MMRWPSLLLVGLAVGLAACADDEDSPPGPEPGGAGGEGGSGPVHCLDPGDPAVHYESDDPNTCRTIVLGCEEGQFGFDNACGCGCVDKGALMCPAPDDPAITWVSEDPFACAPEPPDCPLGELGFSNSCGCGCIQSGSE
jgi:hypothetical protein